MDHRTVGAGRRDCRKTKVSKCACFCSEIAQLVRCGDLRHAALWCRFGKPVQISREGEPIALVSGACPVDLRFVLDCFWQGAGVFLAEDFRP